MKQQNCRSIRARRSDEHAEDRSIGRLWCQVCCLDVGSTCRLRHRAQTPNTRSGRSRGSKSKRRNAPYHTSPPSRIRYHCRCNNNNIHGARASLLSLSPVTYRAARVPLPRPLPSAPPHVFRDPH